MSLAYKNICNGVILRANLLSGGSAATRETAYAAADIEAKITSTEVPYSALKQDVLAAEKEIAEMIANSSNSLYKAPMSSSSALLASGDAVPYQDADGKEFIGSITGVFDSTTDRPLTEASKQEVYRYLQAESIQSFYTIPAYHYAFDGDRIITTVSGFYVKGCIWDAAARAAAFDAKGLSPLPQATENLWICKVLGGLAQEEWFVSEAQVYANLAREKEADFIEGRARAFSLPQIGTKQSNVNARKD